MSGYRGKRVNQIGAITLVTVLCGTSWGGGGTQVYLKKPTAWFASDDAERIAVNLLSWQSELGGWPKNVDMTAEPYSGDRKKLRPTFDNGATTDELRYLAQIFDATKEASYQAAFERGLDYILQAQYPTGGWPQFDPPGRKYHRYITFNDEAMVRLLNFLRETYEEDRYAFLGATRRQAARKAFGAGIGCILACQIRVDGRLTAWCAQHDEISFEPRPARAYEPASISGSESVGIVRLLMSLDDPDAEMVAAVEGAITWFKKVEMEGVRVEVKNGNRIVVMDSSAPSLWARFYEIGTNRPIYCGRDGVTRYDLAEIDDERRNHYSWLGGWPQRLLDQEYSEWKKRIN